MLVLRLKKGESHCLGDNAAQIVSIREAINFLEQTVTDLKETSTTETAVAGAIV